MRYNQMIEHFGKETRQNAGVELKSADKTDVQVFGTDDKKFLKRIT